VTNISNQILFTNHVLRRIAEINLQTAQVVRDVQRRNERNNPEPYLSTINHDEMSDIENENLELL
jgi:hypothetical protein